MAVEAGPDPRLGAARPKLVARDLFLDEAVVRLVGVERIDDVVAIAPSVRTGLVRLEALAFREARQIEPVTGPCLAVARRRQQPIHHAREGLGRIVFQEGLYFFGSGRQAVQVECRAADQGHLVRSRTRLDALVLEARCDESVDRIGVSRGGDFGFRDGLESPMVALVVLELSVTGRLGGASP